MHNSPYSLLNRSGYSSDFYKDLRELGDLTYDHFMNKLSDEIDDFARFRSQEGEKRTREEYVIELLTLAMVWREYLGGSQWSSRRSVAILKRLYLLRTKYPKQKDGVDWIRGRISGLFIYPYAGIVPQDSSLSLENLDRLIEWLDSTGEFRDEVKRFRLWRRFFVTEDLLWKIMSKALKELMHFSQNSHRILGKYTADVKSFRKNLPFNDRWREDALFRNKSEIEYHINMLASEIINRGFREKYLSTSQRVVLLPACMSEKGQFCEREENGLDISCISCSGSCAIGKINKICMRKGHRLNIVPHSSSFSKWLKRWENSVECGLIAVACPLNIVVGGYQMRELNIPSQCLMLDYCGCSKHWGPGSVPTTVNVNRLIKLLDDEVVDG